MSWASENDPHSTDYLLREIRNEIRELRRPAIEASVPLPIPPRATKHFVHGMPEHFMTMSSGKATRYTRVLPNVWEVLKFGEGYEPRKTDEEIRKVFDQADEVWVIYPR